MREGARLQKVRDDVVEMHRLDRRRRVRHIEQNR